MAEYIDREEVINLLWLFADESCCSIVSDIENLPAADVAPVRHTRQSWMEGKIMPKFDNCGHYDGRCPCLDCRINCGYRCLNETECAVDTDKLCERAKEYCERGRENNEAD